MPQFEDRVEHMLTVPYASAVGSIMYAMMCTRPDIAQSISAVSRYIDNLGKRHWKIVKWILRYLKGACDVGLTFQKSEDLLVLDYVNSYYARDLDKKSTTGYIFTLIGSVVSWKSTLQSIVALSTTMTEYMSATEEVKYLIERFGGKIEFGSERDIKIEKVITDDKATDMLTKIVPLVHTARTWREYASTNATLGEQLLDGASVFNKGLILLVSYNEISQ
ncbi:secreted RxLR effector protein 161-like [Solanum dulcamara]|uniref:secreted RxLR effector protein 161-like n=1 Tax=Solanum dulcamara TaxID=45834 RepID=UPI0024862CF4|nr:secreted RxLR effector protein 161-like [Solanum dulcamara]